MENRQYTFVHVNNPPYWDKGKQRFYGRLSAPPAYYPVELFGLSAGEVVQEIEAYTDAANVQVQFLVPLQEDALIQDLRTRLEGIGYQTGCFTVKPVEQELGSDSLTSSDVMMKFGEDVRNKFFAVGIRNCMNLAVFPPEALSQLTGLPQKKCFEYTAIGAFLLIPGMEYNLAWGLAYHLSFSCLENLVKADTDFVVKELKRFYVETTYEHIADMQQKALEVGPHLFASIFLNYTPEQLAAIIADAGVEEITARFTLLTKTFASPAGSISTYQLVVDSLVGEGVISDRQKLQQFLYEVKDDLEKLRYLRQTLKAVLKASFPRWDAPNSVRALTGIAAADVAKLAQQGVYSISDLRICNPATLAPLCEMDAAMLERYRQMADIKSLPAATKDLAYVITDLNLWSECINAVQWMYLWPSIYNWIFDLPIEKRFWFAYSSYNDIPSPVVTRAKELLEFGAITEKSMGSWDSYLPNLANHTNTHHFVRLGIQGPDEEFTTFFSALINLCSRDLCSRLVPVPLTNYFEQAETYCAPITLKIEYGPWKLELPDVEAFNDVYKEDFFRHSNKVGKRLAEYLECPLELTKDAPWDEEYRTGKRSFRLFMPEDCSRSEMKHLIACVEKSFWEEMEITEGYITGLVTDPEGRPQTGVKVQLVNMQAFLYFTTIPQERSYPEMITNESGRYSFRIAHQQGQYGLDGRGAIIQLDYPGYSVSNGYRKLVFRENNFYEFHHIATPLISN